MTNIVGIFDYTLLNLLPFRLVAILVRGHIGFITLSPFSGIAIYGPRTCGSYLTLNMTNS